MLKKANCRLTMALVIAEVHNIVEEPNWTHFTLSVLSFFFRLGIRLFQFFFFLRRQKNIYERDINKILKKILSGDL